VWVPTGAQYSRVSVGTSLVEGQNSLRERRWEDAASQLLSALDETGDPEAEDGLGLALWWTGRAAEGISHRAKAYVAFRRSGDMERAAKIASWLSREYASLYNNYPVAEGWLARGESTLEGRAESAAHGWIALARSEAERDAGAALKPAARAVGLAREYNDVDLEIAALSRLGALEAEMGDVDAGITHIDEAFAAATAGESDDPRVFGDACCALMNASEALGTPGKLARWSDASNAFMKTNEYGLLSAYCGSCCGNLMMAGGALDAAEEELLRAISKLSGSEMESRCVHPVTQLAELRVVQGRVEEAEELLKHYEDLPESARPLAAIDLARGDAKTAAARLRRRLSTLEDRPVLKAPVFVLLVDAEIARGEQEEAEEVATSLAGIAQMSGSPRHRAEAAAAMAKVKAASGADDAAEALNKALIESDKAHLPIDAARVRLLIAELIAAEKKDEAIVEARAALAAFDRLGAKRDADKAASFLRGLGVGGRTGTKDVGVLTDREREVIRLVAQGLSNAEIAKRLFISRKTAGNHVSNILTKLNLRSRTEAAAYAALNLGPEPAAT